MTDKTVDLRNIKRFDQLIAYLRDELDWPIDTDDFDDLTFDYEPEELGIDPKNAAKIEVIKQLRPLVTDQPWGIFWIKFKPKRLPVVALRRILGQLVTKKRASANKTQQATWNLDDLMLISAIGENDERQITFAHFADEPDRSLPTLRILGWDGADTILKLEHLDRELHEHLVWPEPSKESDHKAWRKQWSSAFKLRHKEAINTSKELSVRLAELARNIRQRCNAALALETDKGPLRKLMAAFKQALIHDLEEDDFADMYAQTIAYGLLSARVSRHVPGEDPALMPEDVSALVLPTNPFLKELMETFFQVSGRNGSKKTKRKTTIGIDFDELGINDVVDALKDANMDAVLRDFGDKNPQEDPVIHFYELFLKEYDAKKRMQRGVFYTPRPVVSFIVRSVDELLRTEFGLEDGLADTTTWGEMIEKHKDITLPTRKVKKPDSPDIEDVPIDSSLPFVQILDPATGTGTFLVEVIDIIYKTMIAKWEAEGHMPLEFENLWNDYVPQHLLPRLHGYELMMAPYAIAHMKIGLKLHETGYRFESEERARVYLTNSLELAQDFSGTFDFAIPALALEAEAVNKIKRDQQFTVVIGNPPYSSSICEPPWLMALMDDWKHGLNETKSDLNREEWKFLRFAQHLCTTSALSVLGFIINRDFLDGITKRRMREHLGDTFPLRVIVDLNGDVKGNITDENVFDIEQGVAITVMCTQTVNPNLRFTSREGTKASKYFDLLKKTTIDNDLAIVEIVPPYFRWLPLAGGHESAVSAFEYAAWIPLSDVFETRSSGIQTKNDNVCIGWTASEIWDRVSYLAASTPAKASRELGLNDGGAWSITAAQSDLRSTGPSKKRVRRILYRPFDWRFTYLTDKSGGFLGRPRFDVMKHMTDGGGNIGLIFNRQTVGDSVSHFGVSRDPICHGTFYLGNKGQDYLAPLFLTGTTELNLGRTSRQHNFTSSFLRTYRSALGSKIDRFCPDDILRYIYSVVHSPTYRSRYRDHLKLDFPRIPITINVTLFHDLSRLGGELVALHIMESPKLDHHITTLVSSNEFLVEKLSYSNETVWIDKKQTRGFRGVPEDVWNFQIGGYQVCEKWLKDRQAKGGKNPRPGRILTEEDINHYQKIVVALSETIRIMAEIDKTIATRGGWPDAFITDPKELENLR